MRVLQVITDTDRRGAQVFALDLQAALRHTGVVVETVALTTGRVGGLELESLGSARLGLSTLRRLAQRSRAFDVVVGHGSSTLAAGTVAVRNVPFVYRQISDPLFWAPDELRRLRVRLYYRRPRRVVALSHATATILRDTFRIRGERITVIPNGAPAERFVPATPEERSGARRALGVADEEPLVVYVGALAPEKGVCVLLEAVAMTPSLRLAIAGDGRERESLEHHARNAGGRVQFLGRVGDVRGVLAAADVVALPSLGGDSMPAALIEAGFMGLPAVSTPIGSITEVLRHEETGLVVPPGDVTALADALTRVARTDEGARFGEAARQHCLATFEIGVVAEQWLRLLRAVATGD